MSLAGRHIWHPLSNPLLTFRVFELLPGSPDSTVRLKLHENVNLYRCEARYEAISYTWGDETATHDIEVNDRPYTVRLNLWNFLKRLRGRFLSRFLWADAICINQNDLIEKGHQVSIIGRIFHTAEKVLVWLGEAADGSDEFMKFVADESWADSMLSLVPDAISKLLPSKQPQPSLRLSAFAERQQRVQNLIHPWKSLLQRPYWKRTWIIQELVLAKTLVVHCGGQQVAWDKLQKSLNSFYEDAWKAQGSRPWFQPGIISAFSFVTVFIQNARNSTQSPYHIGGSSSPLSLHISSFKHTECTDPRDKVYALLPLSTSIYEHHSLTVDYTIDSLELFFRTFDYCYNRALGAAQPTSVAYTSLGSDLRRALGLRQTDITTGLLQRPGFIDKVKCSEEDIFR